MNEKRINVRLTEEQHEKFKMIAVKMKKPMNQILVDYVDEIIKKEESNGEH